MSLTITRWEVTGLQVRDQVNAEGVTLTDAVVQTYWKQFAQDADGNEGFFTGATPFTAEDVPAGEFTAFADLTEATVLSWIQDYVSTQPGYQEHISEQIQEMIDRQVNVVRDATMPWAPEEVTPPLPEDSVVLEGSADEVDPGEPE
jgi:hypothetical protein